MGLQSASQVAVEDLPVSEAEEVLAAWLRDAHRKLQPEQREKVLSGFAPSGFPRPTVCTNARWTWRATSP
jgi:hypothetical protein